MKNVLITTYPFGTLNKSPIDILMQIEYLGYKYYLNKFKRKLTAKEHIEQLKKYDPEIIIAGTEKYSNDILNNCPSLKLISRVGIGLDSIDLAECNNRNILVTNTPDAPTNAVAELTIGQILSLIRRTWVVNNEVKSGKWSRYIGKELINCRVGVIGVGRIGKSVIEKLKSLQPKEILYTDIDSEKKYFDNHIWASKKQILEECDIITIHIPLNSNNINYIGKKELKLTKADAMIINTSRGGIVNENDLYDWLSSNPGASAAIDVFDKEPYVGNLINLDNILLTPHLGSCSYKSRHDMEVGAAKNALNFIRREMND